LLRCVQTSSLSPLRDTLFWKLAAGQRKADCPQSAAEYPTALRFKTPPNSTRVIPP